MVAEEREGLRKIRRLRLWFWTVTALIIPITWITIRLTGSFESVMLVLIVWMTLVVHFAARTAFSQCPRCRNCYHVTAGSPAFWNLLTRRCTHCGLPLRSDRVMYPGTT